jgi:hypothetical protein
MFSCIFLCAVILGVYAATSFTCSLFVAIHPYIAPVTLLARSNLPSTTALTTTAPQEVPTFYVFPMRPSFHFDRGSWYLHWFSIWSSTPFPRSSMMMVHVKTCGRNRRAGTCHISQWMKTKEKIHAKSSFSCMNCGDRYPLCERDKKIISYWCFYPPLVQIGETVRVYNLIVGKELTPGLCSNFQTKYSGTWFSQNHNLPFRSWLSSASKIFVVTQTGRASSWVTEYSTVNIMGTPI